MHARSREQARVYARRNVEHLVQYSVSDGRKGSEGAKGDKQLHGRVVSVKAVFAGPS